MDVRTISPQALADLAIHGKPIALVDVRTMAEFRQEHVAFAYNIPLDKLDPAAIMQGRNGSGEDRLYFICRSGSRGQKACELFHNAGFTNVVNVEGGTLACEQAGLPVLRGKKTMSVDRQVRIAAGLLVLLGAVLAWFIHPAFMGLSALVAAEQVVAGMTGKCVIAMLLAKMPWNRCNDCAVAEVCCTK